MPPDAPADQRPENPVEYLRWYFRGCLRIVSIPAFILASSFVGFAALAMQAGITLPQAVFMTGIVWALPGKVVLIGAIIAGNGLPTAAFAVSLSSVRLAPMVVAQVPELTTAAGGTTILRSSRG